MVDLSNMNVIMTRTVPEGKIQDSKQIIYTEQPIPGRNYQPVSFGGNGNRKISFTLPVLRRNDATGNMLILKQFEGLRNQARGFLGFTSVGQFSPNPKVLFQWGHNGIPLVYFVAKCDFEHNPAFVNMRSIPQLTQVSMELILDEENPLYKAEEAFRIASAAAGNGENMLEIVNHVHRMFPL
ncbi:MAG: hypothetical protein LBP19_05335 [Treponema sp.]|nr:hypothetical protein [Treponema sp.]